MLLKPVSVTKGDGIHDDMKLMRLHIINEDRQITNSLPVKVSLSMHTISCSFLSRRCLCSRSWNNCSLSASIILPSGKSRSWVLLDHFMNVVDSWDGLLVLLGSSGLQFADLDLAGVCLALDKRQRTRLRLKMPHFTVCWKIQNTVICYPCAHTPVTKPTH